METLNAITTSINTKFNLDAHQTAGIQFHAQPYNLDATGFYFSDVEEFETKIEQCRDSFGLPVEEFEIQFIDGSSEAASLFKAADINQVNLGDFLELLSERTSNELVAIGYLCEIGYKFTDAAAQADEVCVRDGRLEDAAQELFDECFLHQIPENLHAYIDYSAFAYDCRVSGDLVEFEFAGSTYTITNSNEF
jgi:hypothetical protein